MKFSARARLLAIYGLSGSAGLIFEVALQRELSRAFGVTAWASATVLAAFMVGTTLGAATLGRWSDRMANPVRFYAALEVGIGCAAIATPRATQWLIQVFAYLAAGKDPDAGSVAVIRLLLALGLALVPAFLMGGTFPALSSGIVRMSDERRESGKSVSHVYALNLLGATAGAALGTYALLPSIGLSGTLFFGAALNLVAAVGAAWVARDQKFLNLSKEPPAEPAQALYLAASAWSGFVTFAYEVAWTQLVALVIGSSAYAFGLMLATFLFGLTIGSVVAWRFKNGKPSWVLLGGIQLASSLAVVATLPLWGELPSIFAAIGPHVVTFQGREVVRAAACLAVLSFPSVMLGLFFPLLLRRTAQFNSVGNTVGGMTAVNTLGAAAGSLGVGFFLLPWLGSRNLLQLLSVLGCVVAVLCYRHRTVLQALALAVAAGAFCLPSWNLAKISSGANVYFSMPKWASGSVVFARESVESGLTTVVEQSAPAEASKTLLTNGKFQGNNHGEIVAQLRFSQVPMLFNHPYRRALLIGIGTGASLAALGAQPFEQVDAAELSKDIVEAARLHFEDLNHRILETDRVQLHYADGRNLLLLSDKTYDLITIEISSIWIAGAADLYNREFYALVRKRLSPGGVLQQWVQLHHTTPKNLAVILQTVREELPHLALFSGGGQGQIIASAEPLIVDYPGVLALNARLQDSFAMTGIAGRDLLSLYGELQLDEAGVDQLIAEVAAGEQVPARELVSTDDNLYLEYQTPRGNAAGGLHPDAMIDALERFGPARLHVAGAQSVGAAEHLEGARLAGSGKLKESIAALTRAAELGAPTARLRQSVLKYLSAAPRSP